MPRKSPNISLKLRLQEPLHRKITKAARANVTSANQEMVRRLMASFDREENEDALRWVAAQIKESAKKLEEQRAAWEKHRETVATAAAYLTVLNERLPELREKDPGLFGALCHLVRALQGVIATPAPGEASPAKALEPA
jgi:hypothetical protein